MATAREPASCSLLLAPVLLAGPTAAGKSEIALALAGRISGEIISVDSMQVYRGLDIGTAKPSTADRARVRHHLIDVVDVTEPFDAAKFVQLAHKAVAEIQSRGSVPILCGGTGLYFKAFLQGLGSAPPADAAMRVGLEATPLPDLLRELAERDPSTYESIDRQNPRRVIRAVEVIRLTGEPFSAQRAGWYRGGTNSASSQNPSDDTVVIPPAFIGFARSPEDLRQRIDARVDKMFQRGLVEETRRLLECGLAQNKTAMQAIGCRQVVEHLRGERSLAETIELLKIRTRQFAKRQMTWFRKQDGMLWLALRSDENVEAVAIRLESLLQTT